MKRWIITILVGVGAFASGCAAGWVARGKTEIKFEEVTEAELEAYAKADMEKASADEAEGAEQAPSVSPAASDSKELHKQIDTHKMEYWAKWHDNAGKYITKTELPEGEEPVITEEDPDVDLDEDLVIGDEDEHLPPIEDSDEDEFAQWEAEPDGEYQAFKVVWFAGDNVVVDEDNDPIDHHQRYLGFDPKIEFKKQGAKQNDVSVLYKKNNILKVIYQVTRYPASYAKRMEQEEYGGDDE